MANLDVEAIRRFKKAHIIINHCFIDLSQQNPTRKKNMMKTLGAISMRTQNLIPSDNFTQRWNIANLKMISVPRIRIVHIAMLNYQRLQYLSKHARFNQNPFGMFTVAVFSKPWWHVLCCGFGSWRRACSIWRKGAAASTSGRPQCFDKEFDKGFQHFGWRSWIRGSFQVRTHQRGVTFKHQNISKPNKSYTEGSNHSDP